MNSPGLQRSARARRRLVARAFDRPAATAGRGNRSGRARSRTAAWPRGRATTAPPPRRTARPAARCSATQRSRSAASRAKRMAMAWRSRAGQPAHPVVRMIRARVAEHLRAADHALLELLGERGQRRLVHAQRAQAVPGEGHGHPALILVSTDRRACCRRLHLVEDAREPGASARRSRETTGTRSAPSARARGSSRMCWMSSSSSMHGPDAHCIWSSIVPRTPP